MTERELLNKAQKRVKGKKDFYSHLTSYFIVIGFLFFLNLFTSPAVWWFIWPAMGWGVGLAFHFAAVFGILGGQDDDWEERELKKEIARLKRKKTLGSGLDNDYLDLDDSLELKDLEEKRKTWDDRDIV